MVEATEIVIAFPTKPSDLVKSEIPHETLFKSITKKTSESDFHRPQRTSDGLEDLKDQDMRQVELHSLMEPTLEDILFN